MKTQQKIKKGFKIAGQGILFIFCAPVLLLSLGIPIAWTGFIMCLLTELDDLKTRSKKGFKIAGYSILFIFCTSVLLVFLGTPIVSVFRNGFTSDNTVPFVCVCVIVCTPLIAISAVNIYTKWEYRRLLKKHDRTI